MNTKELKIEAPKGYVIDTEKSTFEKIVFKEAYPDSWRKFCEVNGVAGYWVNSVGKVVESPVSEFLETEALHGLKTASDIASKVFPTHELALASRALAMLAHLRDEYRQGWVPDWKSDLPKYCIIPYEEDLKPDVVCAYACFLAFQSPEVRDLFFKNFKNLILQVKPLLS